MQADEYQTAIAHLMFNPQGEHIPLDLCGLGLTGEAGEAIEEFDKTIEEFDSKKLVKELGDVMWYVTAICSNMGVDLGTLRESGRQVPRGHSRTIVALATSTSSVADMIKKAEWHGKPLDKEAVCHTLNLVLDALAVMADSVRVNLAHVCAENVAKLLARYPNGFVEGGGIRA